MHAVASINLANYQDLADITDSPKKEYCSLHGYEFFVLTDKKYSPIMGFNKIHYVLDIFNQRPDIEWLLFSECDATITNLTIRIEDRIDNDYHFIIPVDQNNINAGNFLARNTPEGRAYLKMIIDLEPEYLNENWAEQQVIIDTIQDHTDIVKIVPQKYMNCYEQHLYDWTDCSKDIFGNDAIWAQGDWIVHWAALEKDRRIARAKEVLPLIVR